MAAENKRAVVGESQTLANWLQGWGHGAPTDSAGALGMLSAEQIARVRDADQARFDQVWMQAAIVHHRGEVAMAKQVQASADSEEVLKLAQEIVALRGEEISRLQIMLANAAALQVA